MTAATEHAVSAVVQANDGFYLAFQSMDLDRMGDVWDHADDVACIHPGWEPLVGWDDVRNSFLAIFAGEDWELREYGHALHQPLVISM